MRHKYMKSLLLAVVALFGLTTLSSAQSYTYKIIVKFITTENVNLSDQDIKLGYSYEDLKTITPQADGTYVLTSTDYNYYSSRIYYSVNGIVGYAYSYDEQYNDDYTIITTTYQINLYKIRFNYAGTNITTISLQSSSYGDISGSALLAVNKDYYLPAGEYAYDNTSFSLSKDTAIDLSTMYSLNVNVNASEEAKKSLRIEVYYYNEAYDSWYSSVTTEWGKAELNTAVKEGKYRIKLVQLESGYYAPTIAIKDINVTSDQDVTFELFNLSVNVNASEEAKETLRISLSYYNEEERFWSSYMSTDWGVTQVNTSLPEKKWRISLEEKSGEYSSITIGSKEMDLTSSQTVSFDVHTVTVKVIEADGTPVEGVSVNYYIDNGNSKHGETDTNGKLYCFVSNGSVFSFYYNDSYISSGNRSQNYTITGDKTITVTIPKIMSFKVMLNGKLYGLPENQDYEYPVRLYYGDQDNYLYARMIEKGTFQTRVNPEAEYAMQLYDYDDNTRYYYSTSNVIKITEGKTIRVGQFATKADGVGLDFFMGNGSYLKFDTEYGWNAVIVGGTPVRIAAVPVGNEQFVCWNINGKEYNSPMIDFTVKDDNTVATAKFTGTIANQVKGIAGQNAENINVTIEGGYLVLPNDVEAEAAIYAMDGKLTKKTGVVGNRIYINNLPDGAYVLVLSIDGRRQTATFIKQ